MYFAIIVIILIVIRGLFRNVWDQRTASFEMVFHFIVTLSPEIHKIRHNVKLHPSGGGGVVGG